MRPAVLIGILALGLALGSIVLGHVIVIPTLQANTTLVDANLARALGEPLALRSAELCLIATVLVAAVARAWLRHHAGTTLGLLAAGLAATDRFVLLPRVHEAWARVDLVAMRPAARIETAEQLSRVHELAVAAIAITIVAIAVLASWKRASGATPS
ncbi:MAG TPA: hypothetical protein VK034_26385 [Enhygromyxa sp.]|nr:hypothetical protein [Enhygromyxa sp.]